MLALAIDTGVHRAAVAIVTDQARHKDANQVIAGVGDIQSALVIDRDPFRRIELCGLSGPIGGAR